MDINATFFVQIFNFFIAYLMLRFLLFKPVITIIQHEEKQEKALQEIIDQHKRELAIQEKERQHNRYMCQEYVTLHQPSFSSQQFFLSDIMVNETEELPSL